MAETSQAKPIEDVRDISAITYGYMASKALFAALDFDLFTHIGRGAVRGGEPEQPSPCASLTAWRSRRPSP